MSNTLKTGDAVSLIEIPGELFLVEQLRDDGYIRVAPTDGSAADGPMFVGFGEIDEVFPTKSGEALEATD